MRYLITSLFIICSVAAIGQSTDPGYLFPDYTRWMTDTTQYQLLIGDTTTKAGKWITMNGEDFIIEGDVFGLRNQTDSVFVMGDSLCAITNGDTLCVYQDSAYVTSDSFCIIQDGDTTCVGFSGGFGSTIYTGNDTITSSRIVYMPSAMSLIFNKIGSGDMLKMETASALNYVTIGGGVAAVNKPMLTLRNNNGAGNVYMEFENTASNYNFGVDRATGLFNITEGGSIASNQFMQFSYLGDSTIVNKDIQIDAGLLDGGGDIGTNGQVLVSTGSGVNWETPSSSGIRISDLDPANATNQIDNDAYQQTWKWDGLAGGSGLKLSSISPGAIGGTQRLFDVDLSGANTTAGQSTYAGYFSNTHTGSTSTNYGIRTLATSGTTNYGIYASTSGGTTGYGGYFDGTTYGLYATGASRALWATTASSGGQAVYAVNTNTSGGTGVYGSSDGSGGIGIWANNSNTGDPFWSTFSSASTVPNRNGAFFNNTTGTPINNFGGYLEFLAETSTTTNTVLGRLMYRWADVTHASRLGKLTIAAVSSGSFTNDVADFYGDRRTVFNGRAEMAQGADVASVAGAIALGYLGNTFEITGTNAITLISNLGFQNGTEITLIFTSTATLTDGTANSGTDIGMELAGNVNFVASADDVVKLLLCEIGGVQRFREVSRTAN